MRFLKLVLVFDNQFTPVFWLTTASKISSIPSEYKNVSKPVCLPYTNVSP